MGRKASFKDVQEVCTCSCGRVEVDSQFVQMSVKDLIKCGYKYKRDPGTGKMFLVTAYSIICNFCSHEL